jgi:hypothetical protein
MGYESEAKRNIVVRTLFWPGMHMQKMLDSYCFVRACVREVDGQARRTKYLRNEGNSSLWNSSINL